MRVVGVTEVVVEAGVVDVAAAVVAETLEVLLVFYLRKNERDYERYPGGQGLVGIEFARKCPF